MPPDSTHSDAPRSLFEAIELAKDYDDGRVPALRGINFRIADGEFVSLIGPSGCGKSTLLNMLGALDSPSSGSLKFEGTHIPDLAEPAAYRAREVGFIFQAFHLLPTFTVEENIQIPMFGLSFSRSERKERAVHLLDAVGLSHRRGHLPSKLSGGERQRAAIARSLVNRPRVLLADEPTGNLDSENAAQIMELLCRLQAEHHTTMVLVTHDLDVARHASRVIGMKDGQIISESAPDDAPPPHAL
jgi:ABC-type lipoprotein export system ATPase subunit